MIFPLILPVAEVRPVGPTAATEPQRMRSTRRRIQLMRQRGIAVESQGAERVPSVNLLAMNSWAHDEEHFVVAGLLRLDGLVDGNGAVDVLLVPEAGTSITGTFSG